jgi:hypothetical protein
MTLEAVDQAIADRKLWRAKEILQGRLASPKFDPDLLRRYGEVLLAMDDKIEAGRHLFCSGFRAPEYSEAIELFLSRNRRDKPHRFLSACPSMVSRQSHLAEFIASPEFELNGWSAEALSAIRPFVPKNQRVTNDLQNGPTSWLRRIREKAVNAFGIAVVMLLFISFVVGAVTILKFAWSIFAR